jgi:hypothetical protein
MRSVGSFLLDNATFIIVVWQIHPYISIHPPVHPSKRRNGIRVESLFQNECQHTQYECHTVRMLRMLHVKVERLVLVLGACIF